MRLFKSALRKRCEKKRNDLIVERENIEAKLHSPGMTQTEYCKLWTRKGDLKDDINLLTKLLN